VNREGCSNSWRILPPLSLFSFDHDLHQAIIAVEKTVPSIEIYVLFQIVRGVDELP
jgi:hypothetical protein